MLKHNYKEEKLTDIINILKELKNNLYINSSIYMENNTIPINWYIDSLIQYLSKLPKNLIENDYENLLNEIEEEITNSIKELNFEELCIFIEYIKEKAIKGENIFFTDEKLFLLNFIPNQQTNQFKLFCLLCIRRG